MMFHGGPPGGGVRGPPGGGPGGRFESDDVLGKVYDSRVIAKLPKYLLPVKRWIGIGALGMLIRTFVTLATPYLIAESTQHIINGNLGGLNIIFLERLVQAH